MCETIDTVVIRFNEDSVFWLNLCVAFIMFGVALDITWSDFKRVFQSPRVPLIGLASQYFVLSILTLSLIYFFRPAPSFALGMMLLNACPGGSVSNYMVHLSRGNTALSITLTSITTLLAVFTTPLVFTALAQVFPYTAAFLKTIEVSPWGIIQSIALLIVLPLGTGMLVKASFPKFTNRIKSPIGALSMLIFFGFVAVAVINNRENLMQYLGCVFVIVTLHNLLALSGGYGFAKLMGLSNADAQAVSIETGIQNTALGLAITFKFFDGLGGMAMVLAWWGIWHLLSGFIFAMIWRRLSVKNQQ